MLITQNRILFEYIATIPCPTCKKGFLQVEVETVIKRHPAWIKSLPEHPQYCYNPEGIEERELSFFDIEGTHHEEFRAVFSLTCSRKQCMEVISTCGTFKTEEEIAVDEYDEPLLNEYDSPIYSENYYYYPDFFSPSIRLFTIPAKTPKLIVEELDKSFSLFWAHPSACGNSMRKVIERIVDELREKPPNHINLGSRIKKLGPEYSAIQDFLNAAKWIGNDGSHQNELTHEDVILGFQFIEFCLIELFMNNSNLKLLVKQINVSKNPISKIR